MRGRIKECKRSEATIDGQVVDFGHYGYYKCAGVTCTRNTECWSFDCNKGKCGDETGLESIHLLLIIVGSLVLFSVLALCGFFYVQKRQKYKAMLEQQRASQVYAD